MATLTLKNVPDEMYAALTKVAKRNRRSINGEAIVRLERSLENADLEVQVTLERIRENREKMRKKGVWLTDEFLSHAKNEGRP